jgi:hypothetical protein
MRRNRSVFRPIYEWPFSLFFKGRKNEIKRPVFPVKKGIFPLLNHDFEVQLIVLKMPLGLYKIYPLYNPSFPKIERK